MMRARTSAAHVPKHARLGDFEDDATEEDAEGKEDADVARVKDMAREWMESESVADPSDVLETRRRGKRRRDADEDGDEDEDAPDAFARKIELGSSAQLEGLRPSTRASRRRERRRTRRREAHRDAAERAVSAEG